jgi:dTDP-4-amino-4,6-dideoxygalactose transaminase
MSIGFYSAHRGLADHADELDRLLESAVVDPAAVLDGLEAEVRARTGARHAVLCNSGTDALVALLIAAGVRPGDEVIVPGYTFFATASCVVHAGATPVFVDVDPDSYALTVGTVRAAITPRTAAVLVVHLFHQMADMAPLVELCRERGVTLLEDSAEAVGMAQGQVHAGLHGRGGVLSFFPTKTWGALGDCGALVTDDEALADTARAVVSGRHADAPWCSAPDAVQAATLLARAPRLADEIAHRRRLSALYDELLADVRQVRTPRVVGTAVPSTTVWYVYLVEVERRDALAAWLAGRGVETDVYYPRPLPQQPCFAAGTRTPGLAAAAAAAERALALPLYADLTEHEVREIARHVALFYAEEGES